jgi:V8-like Glu-specific endopeptidase
MSSSSSATRRIGVAAISALACAAALVPSSATAAPSPSSSGKAVTDLTPAAWAAGRAAHGSKATAQQALEAYWTPKRMREATPAEELPEFKAAIAQHDRDNAAAKRQAAESVARGERPKPAPAGKPFGVPSAKGELSSQGVQAAYNPNYSSGSIAAYTNGKIFFTNAGGGTSSCSGAIVNSPGADTVWTAGHCLHAGRGGNWYSNWVFIPGYDDDLANPRPWGTWTPWWIQTRPAWASNSDTTEDMGVLIMNTNFGGWHIVNYFGGHGFSANLGKYTYENAFGYPSESPFDGGNLMRCWGYATPEWTSGSVTSDTIKIPCDMTRGSSGGPWLYGFDGNWGNLNGVVSRIDRIVGPTISISPYFDNTAIDLYNITRNM